ncbi:MAG: glycoside hydrolase family 127 protein [Planctomycetota bacterium]|nr:glycoside hydrolase family 127 protein [Planctomycetota bacterium]
MPRLSPLSLKQVTLEDGFWSERLRTNRDVTLPYEHGCCKKTGRLDAWKQDWKPGRPNKPHIFWDSDVAKWLEAVAYELARRPGRRLYALARPVVDRILKAQQPDGYINTHFTTVCPGERFTNLTGNHELYCAGHLIEAAVAWFEATGERDFLEALERYADLLGRTFGRGRGQVRGYDGHEEIELALLRLYRATGTRRHLELARYFVDERGRRPSYFEAEAKARGGAGRWALEYYQAHKPVRAQFTAEGHAVRAMYLYTAMAGLALETGDAGLRRACRKLWANVTERRMYVTGGVGSSAQGERFTVDYDLPNESAYSESCAAIGLIFWARKMFQLERDGKFADELERALYNNVPASVGRDGRTFFYANPLAVTPYFRNGHGDHIRPRRQPWFGCACCPPNIARLLASLPSYVASSGGGDLWVHLYAAGTLAHEVGGRRVVLRVRTRYPWDGRVVFAVDAEQPAAFTLALRIPGWCRGAKLNVNGKPVNLARAVTKGYAKLKRIWKRGDKVELDLPMPPERVYAHPKVQANAGRVALRRGPLVYALEQADNGAEIEALTLPPGAKIVAKARRELGGFVALRAKGLRAPVLGGKNGSLYAARPAAARPAPLAFVPYGLWGNRGAGEMAVWVRE